MRTNNAIWIVGVLAAILANECHADLNGRDDFNDNSKDPARWGVDYAPGAGLLTEINGRLEFTTSGAPTTFDVAARPWILNFGSYTQNWEARVDVSVPPLALREVRFGLWIGPGTNLTGNSFRLDLVQSDNQRYFACNLGANGDKIGVADHATTSTSAAVRIVFDASTTVLSAFYDEDGVNCGYTWTFLGSTNVPAAWSMTTTDVFGIWVYGYAESGSVASTNNVFGDNFAASSGPTPRLGISLAGGKAVLAWSTNTPLCQLEVASTLTPPICWQAVTNAPGIVSTNFTVTNAVSSTKAFYRLSR
jgi:hypothetical protein